MSSSKKVDKEDDDDAATPTSLVDEWSQLSESFQGELYSKKEFKVSNREIAKDVLDLKYSDGSEFRASNPYSERKSILSQSKLNPSALVEISILFG